MKLAIVILNWNQAEETEETVRKLRTWERLHPEIWVVDNASRDAAPTRRLRKAYPDVHVIVSERNLGYAGGNNLALREILSTDIEAVLLLNNDALLPEPDAARLIECLQHTPEAGIVGPLVRELVKGIPVFTAGGRDISRHLSTRNYLMGASADAASPQRVAYVPGTAFLVRTDVLRKIGLMDEEYFFSGEIAELCERARQAGHACIVDPQAIAIHNVSAGSPLRATLYLYYTLRNRFLFIRRFRQRAAIYLTPFWIACGLLMCLRSTLRFNIPSARAAWLGVLDGLRGRFGDANARFNA